MEWWEDLEPPVPVLSKAPKRQLTVRERQLDYLRETEDQVYLEALEVVQGSMGMLEINPEDAKAIPECWKAMVLSGEMTQHEALKRTRAASYALMPGKDAPVGLKIAQDITTGIAKARAVEKGGPRSLNILMVKMTAPAPMFASMEEDESS